MSAAVALSKNASYRSGRDSVGVSKNSSMKQSRRQNRGSVRLDDPFASKHKSLPVRIASFSEASDATLQKVKPKKVDSRLGFRVRDFDNDLFIDIVGEKGELIHWEEVLEEVESRAGIVHKIRTHEDEEDDLGDSLFQGMKRFNVSYLPKKEFRSASDFGEFAEIETMTVVIKVKQGNQRELQQHVESLYVEKLPSMPTGTTIHAWSLGLLSRDTTMFNDITDERFTSIMPKLLYTRADEERGHFLLAMEDLNEIAAAPTQSENSTVSYLPSVSSREALAYFSAIASYQSVHYGTLGMEKLHSYPSANTWLQFFDGEYCKPKTIAACREIFEHAVNAAPHLFEEEYGAERVEQMRALFRNGMAPLFELIASLREEKRWFTLVHNDCSTRNACMRKTGDEAIIYDWELASEGLPTFDYVEYLVSSLEPSQLTAEDVCGYIHISHAMLSLRLSHEQRYDMPTIQEWTDLFALSTLRFVLCRYVHFAFFAADDPVFVRMNKNVMQLLTIFKDSKFGLGKCFV